MFSLLLAVHGLHVTPGSGHVAAASGGVIATPAVDHEARRLILLRTGLVAPQLHSPPVKRDAFYGDLDIPLSTEGEAEAAAAAAYICEVHADEVRYISSSPTTASIQCAERIAQALSPRMIGGLEVLPSEQLKGFERGLWTNMTASEVDAKWGTGSVERAHREHSYARQVALGEGIGDVRERAIQMRDYALRGIRPGYAAVIVADLWVMRCLLAASLGCNGQELQLGVPTASVCVIDHQEESWPYAAATELPRVVQMPFKP